MSASIHRRHALWLIGGGASVAASQMHSLAATTGKTQPRRPEGYFALQPGDPAVLKPGSRRIIPDRLLELPHVAGLTIRARWSWLQPERTRTDLSYFEAQTARCRGLSKAYKLLVMTGAGSSPEWLGGTWHAGAPVPWSPQLGEHYAILVQLLGEKFSRDPLCLGVHITGPTFPSAEMHPAPGIESQPGFSVDAIVAAWKASIDAYAVGFPATTACLSISVQGLARQYVVPVVAYGRETLTSRFAVQHNALKASTQRDAPHHRFVADLARQKVTTGFEMVCAAATNAGRFGSSNVMDGIAVGKAAGGVYWDVYPPDLNALQ